MITIIYVISVVGLGLICIPAVSEKYKSIPVNIFVGIAFIALIWFGFFATQLK